MNQVLGKKAYILVHLDKNHVATFCEAQSEIPTDFKHCTPNVYLPIRYNGSWLPKLPSQDYFFAEGKGEYMHKQNMQNIALKTVFCC